MTLDMVLLCHAPMNRLDLMPSLHMTTGQRCQVGRFLGPQVGALLDVSMTAYIWPSDAV